MSALFGGVGGRLERRVRMDDSTARHLEGEPIFHRAKAAGTGNDQSSEGLDTWESLELPQSVHLRGFKLISETVQT